LVVDGAFGSAWLHLRKELGRVGIGSGCGGSCLVGKQAGFRVHVMDGFFVAWKLRRWTWVACGYSEVVKVDGVG